MAESRHQRGDSLSERYRALLATSEAIAAHRDLESLFRDLAERLRAVVDFDGITTLLHDSASGLMRVHLIESRVEEIVPMPVELPVDESPGGWVWKAQQPFIISDISEETRFGSIIEAVRQNGVKSFCLLPLTTANRRLGALGFASLKESAYGESDFEFLQQVANQVAVAIDNAINFESAIKSEQELKLRLEQLDLLLNINNSVVSHLDLGDLMKATSDCLREVMHQDFAGITLYDAESNCLRPYVYEGNIRDRIHFIEEGMAVPLEGTPLGEAFLSGRPLLIARPDPEKFHSDVAKRIMNEGVKSGCAVPLIAHGRKLGVLGVGSFREEAFTEKDLELLIQVAGQIAIAVENALAYREIESLKNKLSNEKLYLEEEISATYDFEQIIGSSAALRKILKQVETVAPTDSTVLTEGETGTGKELIARAIHRLSLRRERTMVKLNCAAIPTGLLESELFGHEKGAFTGAIDRRIGRFELADKGTLFLDEVGEIPVELQPKLLRVLQEREFERLGSARTLRVDARLIAATNRDLEQMVADRRFRDDLYYRLKVFPITVPPLRERPEDIPALVRFFAGKFARRIRKRIEAIPAEDVAALQVYGWPGNIRELENFIERAVILTEGAELSMPLAEIKLSPRPVARESVAPSTEKATLEEVEREHILKALDETNWVIGGANGAASRLGLKRTTLQARMKKLGITRQN
ncbi:MAG: sigma 54-interacting transcriptional regulator [Acidobacteriota bacterium]